MAESKSEKSLGDMLHQNGTPKPNLARRLSREWGKVNEILAIIKEAPLGRWWIASELILRKSMLINTLLCNSKAWYDITYEQLKAFEKSHQAPIKGLVEGHSEIPIQALCLETGQTPIRYIIACRRILYLQTILHHSPLIVDDSTL